MTIPKTISDNEQLLSTADIARELGVHRSTVWGWIKNEMLTSKKHGSFHGVTPAALKRFLGHYHIDPSPPKRKPSKRTKKPKRRPTKAKKSKRRRPAKATTKKRAKKAKR